MGSSDVSLSAASNVADALRRAAGDEPHRRLYTYLLDGELEQQHLTNSQLDRQARAIAASLQSVGVAGERVLLVYPPGIEFIAALFGCFYAEAVAVPAYPPDPSRSDRASPLAAIARDAQARFALTVDWMLEPIGSLLVDQGIRDLGWLASDTLAPDLADEWRESEIDQEAVALLQYTSGSTGDPRGVMITHRNLMHHERQVGSELGWHRDVVPVGWLPLYHDMGLIFFALAPLVQGSRAVLMSPLHFLERPLRWLEAISRHRGTHSSAPNFAYELCVRRSSAADRKDLDLSSWSATANGAEPIRVSTMDRFVDAFGPHGFRREAFYPGYGLAEATLVVSGPKTKPAPVTKRVVASALGQGDVESAPADGDDATTLCGCGGILGSNAVAIVDPQARKRLPRGRVGEIWVSGPSVARGYWNRPQETDSTFHARISDTGEGPFMRTGDLGFLEDGELFITGRIKDVIIIRGLQHYPQDIERTVEESHPAFRRGCGAAFGLDVHGEERLVVVCEIRGGDLRDAASAAQAAVARVHSLDVHALAMIERGAIPKTTSGKIQRRACKRAFIEGALEVVLDWRPAPSGEPAATLLDPDERHRILYEWNDTATDFDKACVQELVSQQAKRTPDAPALAFEDQTLTYAELEARANGLAHHLRSLGVGPDVLVGVALERSPRMLVALLATLKAGGAYLPLDPAHPDARLSLVLEDANPAVILSEQALAPRLARADAKLVLVDSPDLALEPLPDSPPPPGSDPHDLAYVIYTSGSTGKPKGVMVEHHSVAALIGWAGRAFSDRELAGTLASSPLWFDLSVFELFVPLTCGGEVILTGDVLQLGQLAAKHQVTLVNTVPSAMHALLAAGRLPDSVMTVNLAGEAFDAQLVRRIYEHHQVGRVVNLYGPSEATVYASSAELGRDVHDPVPIGRPIANTKIHILDPKLEPVPVGVSGELHIGGAGLARGYLNDPQLTAQKFIADPFDDRPAARLYKSGDVGRYLPDGAIEFVGRIDDQLKIRGHRVEPGEIKSALLCHPEITDAAVVVKDANQRKLLVAYLVGDPIPAHATLRRFLSERLPKYMLPSTFVALEQLPLTPTGKLDRQALPEPDPKRPTLAHQYLAPRGQLEQQIAGIWGAVLGLEQVGARDDFFELGGHSLAAIDMLARTGELFAVEIPLDRFFAEPTVEGVARALTATSTSTERKYLEAV